MSTLQDVATLAGVSISSVSNVLHGRKDRLSRETYQRVEAAIRQLGYRPNLIARQLKTGNAPLIGLLVPSTANPMFGELAVHIEMAAKQHHGLRVLLGNTQRDRVEESQMFEDLLALGVQGVILVSSSTDESHVEAMLSRGMSVVSYDRGGDDHTSIDHVSPDNMQGAHLAVAHLVANGHQRLALATPDIRTASRLTKRAGFLAAAEAMQISDHVRVIEGLTSSGHGDSNMADVGYDIGVRIAAMRVRPTGVITINDMMAFGLMSGLQHSGLSVPHDISVIGMDNLVMTAHTCPPLTSVAVPSAEMARVMVQMLVERLDDPGMAGREVLFAPTLIERSSVAQPPTTRTRARARPRSPSSTRFPV